MISALETLINNVDAIVLLFVQSSYGALAGQISILWQILFILFIAIYGYKVIISGQFNASLLIASIFKVLIIFALITSWDHFFVFIYSIATDTPADIAGVLLQNASASLGAPIADAGDANRSLSLYYDRSLQITDNILEGASWSDIGVYFYAGAIMGAALIFSSYAAMLIILAKLAVAILLAVGPVFILLLMFEATRSLFEGWLRTLLSYAIIPVFIYAVIAFFLVLAENPLTNLEENSTLGSAYLSAMAPFLLITVVAILVMAQVMNMSASITGGLSLSTLGAGGWMSGLATRNPISKAKLAGTGSYKLGRGAHRAGKSILHKARDVKSSIQNRIPRQRSF